MSVMPDLMAGRPTATIEGAVASLERLGVSPERVELIPVSPLESFKGTVVGQRPHAGEPLDEHAEIVLYVSHDGLAERLPHEFLEPLPTTEDEAHVAIEPGQILEFWERQVTAYGPGRRFITVIDRALARLDRELDRVGSALVPLSRDDTFARHVLGYLGLAGLPLREDEAMFLSWELQRLHDWVGPGEGIAGVLEQFLDLPATVTERIGPWLETPVTERQGLGEAALGTVALGPRFRDPDPALHVSLGPVPLARHKSLDADPRWHGRVQALLGVLVPACRAWDYELVLREGDRALALGDPLRGRLGRSSYLAGRD